MYEKYGNKIKNLIQGFSLFPIIASTLYILLNIFWTTEIQKKIIVTSAFSHYDSSLLALVITQLATPRNKEKALQKCTVIF